MNKTLKGIKTMNIINDIEIEKDWDLIIDNVEQVKPLFFKRKKDLFMIMDFKILEELLFAYKFTAEKSIESDGSITLTLNEIDLADNAEIEDEVKIKLAESILEYSKDYYDEFEYWSSSLNRKSHIPYVFKALALNDVSKIADLIEC
ncbi:MAG: hypothetical protein PHY33_06355 [Methanobacteriaceae archaeon]|nr:hypothetical protein [Methanobacteriaceae archaeon]